MEILDLQKGVRRVEAILQQKQEEVRKERAAHAEWHSVIRHKTAKETEITSQLLAARVELARLQEAAYQRDRASSDNQQDLAVEVGGLKSRLAELTATREELRARCVREIERLSLFRRLVKSQALSDSKTNCDEQAPEETLRQIKAKIDVQGRNLTVLNLPKQIVWLQGKIAQKQKQLAASKQHLNSLQSARKANEQELHSKQQELMRIQQHEASLDACTIKLQFVSKECEEATARLARSKAMQAISQARHDLLNKKIAQAKQMIMQIIG